MKTTKLVLGISATALAVAASATPDPAIVAKAGVLLTAADEKLASALSLKAVYTESDEYPGDYRDLRQTGTLEVSKPGELRLEIVRARRVKATDPWKNSGNTTLSVFDGQKEYSIFFHAKSTQVRESEPKVAPKLQEAPILAGFFRGNRSPATALAIADRNGSLEDAQVDGSVVKFRVGSVQRTVELGEDGLIHRLTVHDDETKATKTWTLDSVTLNPALTSSTFKYVVPKDAIPFPAPERSAGIPLGDAVPNFTAYLADKAPFQLGALKGKVVVLEFWATWCWPCNQSIPETQRLVSTYRDKGVESLLVSIKDSRKGFDAWLKNHPQYHDLRFAFDDPSHGEAYEAFLHPTNPTLYVIGRDGKVILKTEGYVGPNPAVEKAIQSAL